MPALKECAELRGDPEPLELAEPLDRQRTRIFELKVPLKQRTPTGRPCLALATGELEEFQPLVRTA